MAKKLSNTEKLQKYTKALIAVVGVILTGLNVAYGTNPQVQVAINVAVALGVYQLPNKKDK